MAYLCRADRLHIIEQLWHFQVGERDLTRWPRWEEFRLLICLQWPKIAEAMQANNEARKAAGSYGIETPIKEYRALMKAYGKTLNALEETLNSIWLQELRDAERAKPSTPFYDPGERWLYVATKRKKPKAKDQP